MGFEEAYVPEDDEERELMEDLHIATRRAHRRGLSRAQIARITAFMASAALAPEGDPKPHSEPENGSDDDEEAQGRDEICPECDHYIDRVLTGMGGTIQVVPCSCTIEWEDRDTLPEKHVEDLEPDVGDDDGT